MGNESPTEPNENKGCFRRLRLIGATLAGIAVLIALVSFVLWRWQLRQDIDAKIAVIKAEGLPLNWEDLAKWPAVIPDDKNAAFIYLEAIDRLAPGPVPNPDSILSLRHPLSDKERMQFEGVVKTNLPALEMLDQVSNASQCRYPVNYADGPTTQLPHLAGLKKMSVLLAYDATLKAEVSNTEAASQDILSDLKLSESLNDEPILISQLVSAAILNTSCHGLEGVLARTPLSEEQLAQLEAQFNQAEATNRFLMALIGERAMTGEFIRLAQDDVNKLIEISNKASPRDDQTQPLSHNPGAGWRLIGFWERDRNFFLGAIATNIYLIQQGPPASLRMKDEGDRIALEARKGFYIDSAMFLPELYGVARRDASNRAYLRDVITALAVERWRLAHHNALPDSLNDLVPSFLSAVPQDPYDEKPLRYKKLDRGYLVYSIGPNLKDDGGKEIPLPSAKVPSQERLNYDIVFTVER